VNIEVERGGVSTHGPSRPRVSDHDTRPVRAPVRRSARRARRRARRWCVLSVSPTGFVDLDVKRRGATGQQTRGPQSVETRGLGPLTPPCKSDPTLSSNSRFLGCRRWRPRNRWRSCRWRSLVASGDRERSTDVLRTFCGRRSFSVDGCMRTLKRVARGTDGAEWLDSKRGL